MGMLVLNSTSLNVTHSYVSTSLCCSNPVREMSDSVCMPTYYCRSEVEQHQIRAFVRAFKEKKEEGRTYSRDGKAESREHSIIRHITKPMRRTSKALGPDRPAPRRRQVRASRPPQVMQGESGRGALEFKIRHRGCVPSGRGGRVETLDPGKLGRVPDWRENRSGTLALVKVIREHRRRSVPRYTVPSI